MKLADFKKLLCDRPYFTGAVLQTTGKSQKTLYNQLNKWTASGEVLRLKRGLFTLNADDRRVGLSNKLAANIIYAPSYISLEYALSFYGMIPEGVYAITSLTTKKTQSFKNPIGTFFYRNIKLHSFFGFKVIKDEFGYDILIAEPEKALIDYLYFFSPPKIKDDDAYFEGSLRLQNLEELDIKKLLLMAERMKSKKLREAVTALERWIMLNTKPRPSKQLQVLF